MARWAKKHIIMVLQYKFDQVVYDEKIFKLFFCLIILNLHNRSKSAKVKSSYENPVYNMLKSS